MAASAYAEEEFSIDQSEARFLYFNTSSTATSLTLLGALILLGVIGYLVYVGGLLGTSNYNRNDYYDAAAYADPNAQYYQQAQYRSANGSQCSKTFMRNSTITILTAKRE